MGGPRLALNALLDACDVVRLWQTARLFRPLLRVVHLRVEPIRGEPIRDEPLGIRRWRWTRELIDAGLRTLELVDCDLRAEQLVVLCAAARARGALEKLHLRMSAVDSSRLDEGGCRPVAAALAHTALAELAVVRVGPGVRPLINVVPTMGALTRLDLSDNYIGAEGARCVAEALNVHVSARVI